MVSPGVYEAYYVARVFSFTPATIRRTGCAPERCHEVDRTGSAGPYRIRHRARSRRPARAGGFVRRDRRQCA